MDDEHRWRALARCEFYQMTGTSFFALAVFKAAMLMLTGDRRTLWEGALALALAGAFLLASSVYLKKARRIKDGG